MKHFIIGALALLGTAATAAELGDDGLHKAAWMQDTFLDLREDQAEAEAQGKTLMLMIEQRGCIYCTKMHEEIFPIPEIDAALHEKYFVVQINMFGDLEIVDFDGTVLTEKEAMRRWNVLFTPMMIFLPGEAPDDSTAMQAAAAAMPGAFGKWTTLNLLNWVHEGGYDSDEPFQKYHARILQEAGIVE